MDIFTERRELALQRVNRNSDVNMACFAFTTSGNITLVYTIGDFHSSLQLKVS